MVPTEFGKFEPQAIRSAPNVAISLPKNVSGVALPQDFGVTLSGEIFRNTCRYLASAMNSSACL